MDNDRETNFTLLTILLSWLRENKKRYNQEIQTKIYKLANLYEEILYDIKRNGGI